MFKKYELCKANELKHLPIDLTDNLHGKFGFRTGNEITTTSSIKKNSKN